MPWKYAVVTSTRRGSYTAAGDQAFQNIEGPLDKVLNDVGAFGYELVAVTGGTGEDSPELYLKLHVP